MTLAISSKFHQQLLAWANDAGEDECCGLIFGYNNVVEGIELTKNISDDRRFRFEIDPARLIAAQKAARAAREFVLGYFHSHPVGRALPSATDTAMANMDGRIWVIIGGTDVTAWKMTASGKFQQQEVEVITCSA